MPTTEAGHHANRSYEDQDGNIHINGASLYLDELGTALPSPAATPAAITGATTITLASHHLKTVIINSATGAAITLPAMTGSGGKYRFVFGITTSSGSWTIVATGAHLFGGVTMNTDTTAGTLFTCVAAANASGSTTMTFDGTTRGGRKGDWVEIEDVATGVGIVRGSLNGSGTEATPFS